MGRKHTKRFFKGISGYLENSSLAVQADKADCDLPKALILNSGQDPGLFFGEPRQCPEGRYIGMRQGTEGNVLVVGGNGSGKSAGIAKPTLALWQGAICATDIKGELSDYYADLTQRLFQQGIVARPYIIFDPTQTDSPSYDPFWWLLRDDSSNLVNNIEEIALAIIPFRPDEKEPFWTETERGVLAAALLYYFQLGLGFSETICKILEGPLSSLCEELSQSDDIRVRAILGQLADIKKETMAAVDRGLRNKIMLFAVDPYIAHAFRGAREGANCFNWDDLYGFNIFLRIPANRIEQWGGAMNLMYTQLIRYLERRPEKYTAAGEKNIQTLLLMDEFARFGKLEMITAAMSTLRSKNVNICLMIQSVAQLDSIYGECRRRIIFDNCQYQAILRADDAETQKYLSGLIGTCIRRQHSVGQQMDNNMDTTGYSQQISEIREYRVFPHELSTLSDILLLSPYGFHRVKKLRPDSFPIIQIVPAPTARRQDIKLPSLLDTPIYFYSELLQNEGAQMLTIEERANNAAKRVAAAEHQQRVERRQKREEDERKAKRRNYIIGELVAKYFPELLEIEPGNEDENKVRFRTLEAFLIELASDKELVERLKKRACWDLETGVFKSEGFDA